MSWGMIGVIMVGASIATSVGTTYYQNEQEEEAQKEREKMQREADAEAKRIRMAGRTNQQEAATVTFGSQDTEYGDYTDFLTPAATTKKSMSGLGTSTTSGLGFS